MQSGLIFDIKKYAINDGPGIRTTIFFKGCHLNCTWCHNPESISPQKEKMYSEEKCIGCRSCVDACPENACTLTPQGIVTDPDKCKLCGICEDVCPTNATEISGKERSVEALMKIIENERIFYDQSGGGVTFSGGEPTMFSEQLLELLKRCKAQGIHTTVDTTGFTKPEILKKIAEYTDYFLYDLKLMDEKEHKNWTGAGNKRILENLKMLCTLGAEVNIRIPLIKGVNNSRENIIATAQFISELPGKQKPVNLLPYHNIAANKYKKLGREWNSNNLQEPDTPNQKEIMDIFEQFGLKAMVGG